jgi:DNA modification methylase
VASVTAPTTAKNRLYYGDNLEILQTHIKDESVDLVYLDPPFNSNRSYNVIFGKHLRIDNGDAAQIEAFGDTWAWTPATEQQYEALVAGGLPNEVANALIAMRALLTENDAMAYLVNMAPRLVELHRVLKTTGSFYLHCDPTMSHYLKRAASIPGIRSTARTIPIILPKSSANQMSGEISRILPLQARRYGPGIAGSLGETSTRRRSDGIGRYPVS